ERIAERILVRFDGEGSGVEELTWAQIGFWQAIEGSGRSRAMGGVAPVPPGFTVDDAVEMLRFIVSRHQALRTRLRFDEPGKPPKQVCETSGEVALEVVDAGDADPAEVAEAVLARYREVDFDYEHEWPVRMAMIRKNGVLTHASALYLHLSMDFGGLVALLADLDARDPVTGAPAGPVTGPTPLARAPPPP